MRATRLLAVLATALLVGCGTTGDGPGRVLDDPSAIASATPRDEPQSRYGNPDSYVVDGQRYYVMDEAHGYVARGIASWYGSKFHGRRTSSGEPYDMYAMSAAHKSLPLPTYVQVTNLRNGRRTVLRVNDRGPFVDDRLIDLSYAAAAKLGVLKTGTAPVEVRSLRAGEAPPTPQARSVTESSDDDVAGGYFVQAGAFTDAVNAYRLQGRLQAANLDVPVRVHSEGGAADGLYRVRLGPLSDSRAVRRLTSRLAVEGLTDSHVVLE